MSIDQKKVERHRPSRGILFALFALVTGQAFAVDLVGHGGPVRAIRVLPDGQGALTASFDSTLIRWSIDRGRALQVLRFHNGSVNALALLPGSVFASGGEDGRIALWQIGHTAPIRVLDGHTGPISALAVSPDGKSLASASWDGTARRWSLGQAPSGQVDGQVLADHKANVNGIAFLLDGTVVTGDYEGRVRIFAKTIISRQLEAPVSALAVAGDEIVAAGADGTVRLLAATGEVKASIAVAAMPLATIAVSADGAKIAVAGFRGTLAIIDRASRTIERKLEGPAFPVWSLAFSPDGKELFTGGANRSVRRWIVATGEPVSPVENAVTDVIPARLKSHPGAEVFRACSACHALTPQPDGGQLAGPTLAGIFGRRIATAPNYDFSPALKSLEIVWTEQTIQRLFEIGPTLYTPGTKMPEQKIVRPEDRQALTDFLKEAQKQ